MGMKVTKRWLERFVYTEQTSDEIGNILTNAGLELDEIINLKPDVTGVVTGYVHAVSKHPDATRLNICDVEVGSGARLSIVCGCSTVRSGIYVAVATVGARLPNNIKIKKSKLRGVYSEGMLCSGKELGLNFPEKGIMHLKDSTNLGVDIIEHLDLDDVLFDFDVTPNRGDCLSVKGIARELVAFSDAKMLTKIDSKPLAAATSDLPFKVSITATTDVRVYSGAYIKNVDIRSENKQFIKDCLEKIDVGLINTAVDTANYLMFEYGQPFHIFDADLLEGDICVRYAKSGEKIKILTGETLELDDDILVIADSKKIVAIAGVMGALSVAVTENTKNIFVESACFSPKSIAKACRKFKLNSDSAYRFERGIDYSNTIEMRNVLVHELLDIVGGEYVNGIELFGENISPNITTLLHGDINKVLGLSPSINELTKFFSKIGIKSTVKNDVWTLEPPAWRSDLNIAVDYIEEALRLIGYANIPKTPLNLKFEARSVRVSKDQNVEMLKDFLAANSLREVISYSFISEQDYLNFNSADEALKLINPISKNMEYMRETLVSGLLKVASHNYSRQKTSFRLFEVGQCFLKSGQAINKIAAIFVGQKLPQSWREAEVKTDFFDAKGILESVFHKLNLHPKFHSCTIQGYHPGMSANIILGNDVIGKIAVVHPKVLSNYKLPEQTIIFEFDLKYFINTEGLRHTNYSNQPKIKRDLSLLCPPDITFQEIYTIIKNTDKKLLKEVSLFDVYQDDNMKKGEKSLAISLVFQHDTNTLHDNDVNIIIESITSRLEQANIYVRV